MNQKLSGRAFLALLLAALLACVAGCPRAQIPRATTSELQTRRLRERLSSLRMEYGVPSFGAAVISHGELLFEQSEGWADVENQAGVTRFTYYPIASLAKVFTATAVLRARQEGLLSLNDAVANWLPEFSAEDDCFDGMITVRDLLAHTAGLDPGATGFPPPRVMPPGLFPAYGNASYRALVKVAGAAAGKPWPEALRGLVLSNCAVDSEAAPMTEVSPRDLVKAYPRQSTASATHAGAPLPVAEGDLAASLSGMVLFLRALTNPSSELNRRGDLLAEFAEPLAGFDPPVFLCFDGSVDAEGNITRLIQTGIGDGIGAELVIYPQERAAVVILTNSTFSDGFFDQVHWELRKAFFASALAPEAPPQPILPADAAGTYSECAAEQKLRITGGPGGSLLVAVPGSVLRPVTFVTPRVAVPWEVAEGNRLEQELSRESTEAIQFVWFSGAVRGVLWHGRYFRRDPSVPSP